MVMIKTYDRTVKRYAIQDIELYNSKGQQLKFDTKDENALHIKFLITETNREDGTEVELSIQNIFELQQYYSQGMSQTITLYWEDDPKHSTTYECQFKSLKIEPADKTQDIWFTFKGTTQVNNALSKRIPSSYVRKGYITSLNEMITFIYEHTKMVIITDANDYNYDVYVKDLTYYSLIKAYFPKKRLLITGSNIYAFDTESHAENLVEIVDVDYGHLQHFSIELTDLDDEYETDESWDVPVDYDDEYNYDVDSEYEHDDDYVTDGGYIEVLNVDGTTSTVFGRIRVMQGGLPGVTLGSLCHITFLDSYQAFNFYRVLNIDSLYTVTSQTTDFSWDNGWQQEIYLQQYSKEAS